MLTEKQKTVLNEMRRLFKITQCPNAKVKIELLNVIEDAFVTIDAMSIDDIKAVTKKILNDNKIPGGDRR